MTDPVGEDLPRPVVGKGPWEGPWPDGDHWDPELLRDGDRRNVEDEFRYWRLEAIVAELATRRHGFHVAIENWEHDFNIGSVVRTANAFNAGGVHVIGRRRWNRRGAMVTDRYLEVHHHPSVAEFVAWARGEGLTVLAVDNVDGSVPIETFDLPERCALVFGQEGPGLSSEVIERADSVLEISQFGSTRSINAGAAAAITMHAWVRRHVFGQIARSAAPGAETRA
ncbi:RNA methyltransferase [Kocuria coralli]|uniref:RNA methyltransferase n=1 Tax=Kocuria coralli TaxID=1461025 RepID=A0A5J5KYR8_9MICC|nr:RNA methyltransferase [Kocuria coralli]KAA9393911.1 RNA methyltransferase [Kocuria coralli]